MGGTPLVVEGRKEYKDEQLLARLIGAAVLLAIAVIVLPFVLDGAGSQHEYEYAETLPVEPDRPILEQSYSSRQRLPPAPTAADIEEVVVTVPVVEAATTVAGAASQPPSAAASTGGQQTVTGTLLPVTPESRSDSVSNQIPFGWNIQVASFVRQENANKLLDRLGSENLSAYVNKVDGKQRPIFRVFVGPVSNQIDALALKNRIDRSYRVESIMVKRN